MNERKVHKFRTDSDEDLKTLCGRWIDEYLPWLRCTDVIKDVTCEQCKAILEKELSNERKVHLKDKRTIRWGWSGSSICGIPIDDEKSFTTTPVKVTCLRCKATKVFQAILKETK